MGNYVSGINDTTAASNNAYYNNSARANAGIGQNYVGLPAGTPVVVWTIPGPVPVFGPADNLDIRP